MQGLATDKAPSTGVVIPHFVFAAISFFVLTVLTIFSGSSFTGYFFQPKLLALTHIAALGWGTMIIFGALYQLIPVVFETALYSERLAKITFWLFGAGIVAMVYSFWIGSFTRFLPHSAGLTLLALILFIVNVMFSVRKAEMKNIKSTFIVASIHWLGITALLGTLIAFNYKYNFLSESHLIYLKMHAHLGLIGWFLLLIMGAASTLVPMFLVSHQMNENNLKRAFYFINIGLILLILDWLFLHGTMFLPVYVIIIAIGIIFFLAYIRESYRKRLRKGLDIGMKHTMVAIVSLLIPIILGIIASLRIDFEIELLWKIQMLYGFAIFYIFITSIILGQTYKTIPFIVWLKEYKSLVGKSKTPLPKELYSEKFANFQLIIYLISIVAFIIGIVVSNYHIILIGAIFLLITAVLYNINIFKIITHKAKSNINNENSRRNKIH